MHLVFDLVIITVKLAMALTCLTAFLSVVLLGDNGMIEIMVAGLIGFILAMIVEGNYKNLKAKGRI